MSNTNYSTPKSNQTQKFDPYHTSTPTCGNRKKRPLSTNNSFQESYKRRNNSSGKEYPGSVQHKNKRNSSQKLRDSFSITLVKTENWADQLEARFKAESVLAEQLEKYKSKIKMLNVSPTKQTSIEENMETIVSRQKQIDYGYATESYKEYRNKFAKNARQPHHPLTPNKFKKTTRRSWDKQIKIWRKHLHHWDDPDYKWSSSQDTDSLCSSVDESLNNYTPLRSDKVIAIRKINYEDSGIKCGIFSGESNYNSSPSSSNVSSHGSPKKSATKKYVQKSLSYNSKYSNLQKVDCKVSSDTSEVDEFELKNNFSEWPIFNNKEIDFKLLEPLTPQSNISEFQYEDDLCVDGFPSDAKVPLSFVPDKNKAVNGQLEDSCDTNQTLILSKGTGLGLLNLNL